MHSSFADLKNMTTNFEERKIKLEPEFTPHELDVDLQLIKPQANPPLVNIQAVDPQLEKTKSKPTSNIVLNITPKEHCCMLCNYTTAIKDNLMDHVKKVHTKIKPNNLKFICQVCSSTFNDYQVLNKHVENQHMGPFSCDFCKKVYKTNTRYRQHLKEVHGLNDLPSHLHI